MSSRIDSDTPPWFQGNGDYASWKIKFAAYVHNNHPNLWSLLTEEEQKNKDKDKKAYLILTKCLPSYVMACCNQCKTAYDVWRELEWRFGKEDLSKAPKLEDEVPNHSQASVSASLSTANAELTQKVDVLSTENRRYRVNEQISKNKIEEQHKEIRDLKTKISCQQLEIDSLLNEICLLKKEKKVVKTEPSSSSAPVISVFVSAKKDTEAETSLKKNKGKAKVSAVSKVPEKDSASPVVSTSKTPVTRVSASQPSAEKEKIKSVCCFYCKTHGHLVKDCVLLTEKRKKRKEMLQRQAYQKINNAPAKSSRPEGRYVPPHARDKVFISNPVPPQQVSRVKSSTADVPRKTNQQKKPTLNTNSRCSSLKNTLKAKAKGEYSKGEFSANKVALTLLERLLSDLQQIMEVSVKTGHTGWKHRRPFPTGQHVRAQPLHA